MHRNDTSRFLLYMEPKKEEKLRDPINDELTMLMQYALDHAKCGSANYSEIDEPEFFKEDGWMGWHTTDCGHEDDNNNNDYLLENGMITNSMCVFYVQRYRHSISENDWKKLVELGAFYDIDISLPKTFPNSPESTKKKTYEEHMKEFEQMMVDELTKTIQAEIVKKIKDISDGKK